MKILRTSAVLALALAPAAFALPAHAAGEATVSILHGVPGATVDVYANGKALLTNFKPGTLTDPVMLPAGTYDLKVTAAGAGAGGAAVIEAKGVKVPADANITVVAHLDANGKPILTPYVNDTSKVPAGQARVTVRHDAAAPAVDVRANGTPVFKNLTNPNEAKGVVKAGTIKADVVLAGTDTVAIGPADLTLKEGTNTIVYAWGSAADKNLKLAVQTISGMHSAPGGVPAGEGTGSNDAARYVLVAGSAAVAGGLVLTSRRRATERA
ncbi:hypothetical protein N865_09245 [Intrasporangium oryzae NRRL B-24470]|uniref:DUF4397 domain-containing protein n=1 Tax=Intrasporangium oryzae NRRL B-24470 TaxID=1386089 RepID=W9GBP7_9MICO|nr:DUF4397 domain-containing protein [Intrasporangium oryzae]EWT03621.1 hypothetical protein N865_09245 [Intrasporangium oryzae NRRL B-24470]